MIKKRLTKQIFMAFGMIFLLSCNQTPQTEEEMTLRMVYTEWSESIAITHLSAVLLEENMNYNVELKLTDVKSVYDEVANGEADIFADAWLPETHKSYVEEFTDGIELIGIIYPEARIGFIVPAFSELVTIADLKTYQNSIIGIDEGSGVMQKARQAIEKYDLPGSLLNLSENEMVRQLEDSLKRRREIVITGWSPHWILNRYDLKFLEDPESVFGLNEHIYIVGRKGFEESHQRAARFFERMQLNENQLNDLVYQIRLSEDPRQGVKNWIKENEFIVNQWTRNLKPKREKVM